MQHADQVKVGLVNQFVQEANHVRENPEFGEAKELNEDEKEDWILAIAREADDSLGFTAARLEALYYKALSDAVTIMDGFSKITGVASPTDKSGILAQSVAELHQGPANAEEDNDATMTEGRKMEAGDKVMESVGTRNKEIKLFNKEKVNWDDYESRNPVEASMMDANAQATFVKLKGVTVGSLEWKNAVKAYLGKGYLVHRAKYKAKVPTLSDLLNIKMSTDTTTINQKLMTDAGWFDTPANRQRVNGAVKAMMKIVDKGDKKSNK